jgi:hypothetical protein
LLLPLAAGLSGCGDALLPSDFSGPDVDTVSGTVIAPVDATKDAARPRLALEWLAGSDRGPRYLLAQPLAYQRSAQLTTDWDIGLRLPVDEAKFDWAADGRRARIGVGRMVYFDDHVADGRLDRTCAGASCDEVKAVSAQFVVYVDAPIFCQPSDGVRGRLLLAAGYHYYGFEGGSVRDLGRAPAMSFVVTDRAANEGDARRELEAFRAALLRYYAPRPLDGC